MSHTSLPVFDLSFISSGEEPPTDLLQRMNKACRGNGFFQIVNHGVPISLQEIMLDVTREFYALSLESKEELSLSYSYKRRGKVRNFPNWRLPKMFMQ